MNCIPEETAMLYVEQELEDTAGVEAHLAECGDCGAMVAMLREENAALVSVLREPAPNRRVQALAHIAGSIAASAIVAVPAQWAASMLSDAGMWANHVAAMPFELAFRAARAVGPLAFLVLLTQIAAPAMTRRTGQGAVVIGREETIQDSVFATGETVLVEGKIEGTLFMFGRSLEVRGEVDGDVFAGGQDVRVTGKVNGNVISGAETLTVRGMVTGSVYVGGRNIHIDSGAEVQREVVSGSDTVTVEGKVGRGLTSGASTAVIGGTIGRGISFSGERLLIRPSGIVQGAISATLNDAKNFQMEPGAQAYGKRDIQVREPANQRGWTGTIVWEVAVLAGAFLTGWLLLAVFPSFYGGAVQSVLSWASAGYGFVALIVTPIAAVILCITLLGIPLGIATLMLYLTGVYLAKIVVGGYLGRELLGARDGLPTLVGLLVGIALLQAVFLVPYGGGILKLAATCLGLGALTLQMRRQVR